jgi:VanZ family protein
MSIPDGVQNVMLFVPFGVLGGLACRRRVASQPARVALVTVAGASLSALVEALQLLTTDRVTAASDVAANTLGAFAGVVAVDQARRHALALLREHGASRWLTSRWTYPALIALGVLLVSAWQPFDLTLDVSTVGSKVRALTRDPWQSGPWTDEGNAIVLYTLATMALARWFEACSVARPGALAVAAGSLLAIGLESSQALVSSRTPAGSDAAVRLLGVAAGAVLLPVVRRAGRPTPWLTLLFGACVAGAAISNLSPFQMSAEPEAFSWFPFLGYYDNNWFPAVSHVIELMLTYFPVGFVSSWWRLSRRTLRVVMPPVAVAAIAIEYAQSWFVGRHADITDVAFSIVGCVLGAWCGQRGADLFEHARTPVAR